MVSAARALSPWERALSGLQRGLCLSLVRAGFPAVLTGEFCQEAGRFSGSIDSRVLSGSWQVFWQVLLLAKPLTGPHF